MCIICCSEHVCVSLRLWTTIPALNLWGHLCGPGKKCMDRSKTGVNPYALSKAVPLCVHIKRVQYYLLTKLRVFWSRYFCLLPYIISVKRKLSRIRTWRIWAEMFIVKNAVLASSAMAETKVWSALGWLVQTRHTSIRVNIIRQTPIMWQLSSKIPVVNSYFLKILVLISTLLSSICRSSCCYSRNTNISSGLDLSSILLMKIRHFFYIVSLNTEWQGRLVSWLASHFTSLGPEH